MKVSEFIMMTVVMSMFAAGITTYIVSVDEKYNLNMSQDFAGFTNITATQSILTDVGETLQTREIGEEDDFSVLFKVSFSSAKNLVFNTPKLVTSMIYSGFGIAQTQLGIPVAIQAGLITLMLTVVVFGLLYAFLKIKW